MKQNCRSAANAIGNLRSTVESKGIYGSEHFPVLSVLLSVGRTDCTRNLLQGDKLSRAEGGIIVDVGGNEGAFASYSSSQRAHC